MASKITSTSTSTKIEDIIYNYSKESSRFTILNKNTGKTAVFAAESGIIQKLLNRIENLVHSLVFGTKVWVSLQLDDNKSVDLRLLNIDKLTGSCDFRNELVSSQNLTIAKLHKLVVENTVLNNPSEMETPIAPDEKTEARRKTLLENRYLADLTEFWAEDERWSSKD